MRICRFRDNLGDQLGFYDETGVAPAPAAAAAYSAAQGQVVELPTTDNVLELLPHGAHHEAAKQVARWLADNSTERPSDLVLAHDRVELLVPVLRPRKIFMLAGNYSKHIEEGGGAAVERAETFPYVFMKPMTTLTNPNACFRIPAISPAHIDWECELAVVIGREAKEVTEVDALDYVAGFTVINDISDRQFRPNSQRKERPKDQFFDWLHGKWHDGSCPCGPCITSSDSIPDPQQLAMKLAVNSEVHQDSSTSQQVFPVAAVVEFVSSFLTLEPGDIISTGTPHGVGFAKGTFLKPGDRIEATIESIGTLATTVE